MPKFQLHSPINHNFQLHGICLVKNEADIIARSLTHHARFFDHIYVFDNGSTDTTWKTVNTLAETTPNIIPFQTEERPFRDGLRALPFNHFRARAQPGDWYCRLDADEIYPENPKDFLTTIPTHHHVVWSAHLQYYFTEKDEQIWSTQTNPPPEKDDFSDLPRHYRNNASEPRFFRFRNRLTWSPDHAWPLHLGLIHPRRIPVKHYQWRTPKQIQHRLTTRRQAAHEGYVNFLHTIETDWHQKIVPSSDLHYDDLTGNYTFEENAMPQHLESPPTRLLKSLLHRLKIWP